MGLIPFLRFDTALAFGDTSRPGCSHVRRNDFDRLILHGATVHTLDDAGRLTDAVGFAEGRVTAAGTLDEVRAVTPNAEERDLRGAHVYPGFIDAHHHLSFAATYENFPEVRCPPYRTVDEVLAEVGRLAASTPEGEWIVAIGYNEVNLAGHRKPTRFDLDRVAPKHPVLLIHFTYHEGVLNSLGLGRAGFSRAHADPPGGWIERTPIGEPNGIVFERCFGHAEQMARNALLSRDREGWFRAANAYQDRVLAAGITHVCDAAVPPGMEALYREWLARGELHVGVTMMPLVENMFAVPRERLDSGSVTGWRDGRLSVGGLKLFTDGGTSCALCLTLRDAIVQFGVMIGRLLTQRSLVAWRLARQQRANYGRDGRIHMGLLYYESAALEEMVRAACARGFSVGIHAGGNEAIEQAIGALARAYRGNLPPRIDHFFFVEDDAVRRAAGEGIHAVVQPCQLHDTGDLVLQTGLPGRLGYQSFGRLRDGGVVLAGSSDAPVCTFSVLAAIETAVRRRLASGATLDPDEALSVAEVLRMYTRGAAATLGMDGEIGQLARGARADAVVLSEDLEGVPAERITEVGILSTFAGRCELHQ
jgi:predicted amidohydrolase YtcJ